MIPRGPGGLRHRFTYRKTCRHTCEVSSIVRNNVNSRAVGRASWCSFCDLTTSPLGNSFSCEKGKDLISMTKSPKDKHGIPSRGTITTLNSRGTVLIQRFRSPRRPTREEDGSIPPRWRLELESRTRRSIRNPYQQGSATPSEMPTTPQSVTAEDRTHIGELQRVISASNREKTGGTEG